MSELARILLLLAIAGSAVTFMGSAAIWFMDEERRIRRALRHVLKGEVEAMIVAHGRGRGAGFSLAVGQMVVAWDSGAWCLIYRLDELMGAELLLDGEVIGRVFRGEPRRALDHLAPQANRVTLRLIFDDPRHADFELDLWAPGDEQRRESRSPADAVQEANRWLARCEAIVRRPQAPRGASPAVQEPRVEPADEAPLSRPPEPQAPAPVPAPVMAVDAIDPEARLFEYPHEDEASLDLDPPWDDEPAPPPPAPVYKPVSKAKREARAEQDELPFDLDD